MSHLRPGQAAFINRKFSCRRGRHRYGVAQQVGGGIVRQVCAGCGSVTIDLTGVTSHPEERAVLGKAWGGRGTGI